MAKPDNTGINSSVRYLALFVSALCVVGLVSSLIHKLLPLLQVCVPIAIGWWVWQRQHKLQQRQQKSLNATFYRLLRKHQGRMTLLDFAMTTEMSAIAARHYLDNRAKEFAARFEVTDQGDVIYVFSTLKFPRAQLFNSAIASPAIDHTPSLPQSLTQAELAKRLGVTAKTISRKKLSSDFTDWTQAHDPDGICWSYDSSARRFLPVESQDEHTQASGE